MPRHDATAARKAVLPLACAECLWLVHLACRFLRLLFAACCLMSACCLLLAACCLLLAVCCLLLAACCLLLPACCFLLAACCCLLLTACCVCFLTPAACWLPLAALATLGACRLLRLVLAACCKLLAACCLLFAACFFVSTRQLMRHPKPDPAILAELAASDPRHTRRVNLYCRRRPRGTLVRVEQVHCGPNRTTCVPHRTLPLADCSPLHPRESGITDLLKSWSLKATWRRVALSMASRWWISRIHRLPYEAAFVVG